MMAHTPGPWTYKIVPEEWERNSPVSEWTGLFIGPLNEETGDIHHTIFEGCFAHGRDDGDTEEDARLIAAAPELLEAAEKLANEVHGLEAFSDMIREAVGETNWGVLMNKLYYARTAIAKAKGETGQ